ncbi:hypothetical protein [Endozoicomonas sp. ALB091]|uniref:hypothetical protein n=1 Tax=Endozoicomonas sp. ALB091 TaxID=3403073 RepID=UPI003BB6FB87
MGRTKGSYSEESELSAVDLAVINNFEALWSERAVELGVQKVDLARKAGYTKSFLYRVLRRERRMPDQMIKVAAEMLDVPAHRIKPVDAGKVLLSGMEATSNVPVFTLLADLLAFKNDGVLPDDVEFMPSYVVQKRYLALRDTYGEVDSVEKIVDFRRKLGFCALILNQNTWFAKKADYLIIDLDEAQRGGEKITLWTWNKEAYVMGYMESLGPVTELRVPGRAEALSLEGAEYIGYVRGVQFE